MSNGPITGYRLYIGDSDGIYAQGGSNTTLKVSVRRDTEISVGVVAINSAGESSPIVQVFSLNSKVNNHTSVHCLYACYFSCPRNTAHICFEYVFSKIILGSTCIIHSRFHVLPSEVCMEVLVYAYINTFI